MPIHKIQPITVQQLRDLLANEALPPDALVSSVHSSHDIAALLISWDGSARIIYLEEEIDEEA